MIASYQPAALNPARQNFRSVTVPQSSQVRSGCAHLGVEIVDGLSAVTSAWAQSPLKLLVPRPRGPNVWAYLSNLGGGLVAGDETGMSLELGERAHCFLSTQASTKVYRNPQSRPCSHWMEAKLADGSLLIHAPDPIQAFAGLTDMQRQKFFMQPGIGLVLVDWFCPGRPARGERWEFNRFQSRNEIFVGDERVFLDSLLLDPAHGPLDGPHRMGRFNCMALILILGEPLRAGAARVLADVAAQPVKRRAPLIGSASAIPHGTVIRLAGEQVEDVGREIQRHLDFVPALLHDDPWLRKW